MFIVIPAEAGIQTLLHLLDSRLRGNDNLELTLNLYRCDPEIFHRNIRLRVNNFLNL